MFPLVMSLDLILFFLCLCFFFIWVIGGTNVFFFSLFLRKISTEKKNFWEWYAPGILEEKKNGVENYLMLNVQSRKFA